MSEENKIIISEIKDRIDNLKQHILKLQVNLNIKDEQLQHKRLECEELKDKLDITTKALKACVRYAEGQDYHNAMQILELKDGE